MNYRDRTGRTLQNDREDNWLKSAMAAAYRVLKQNWLMVCFYGWPRADDFLNAWRKAGFHPVGHFVFRKSYTSSAKFMKCQHEQGKIEPKTVQGILRHSKIQTTLDLYTQEDSDETRAAQGAFLKTLGVGN